MVLSTEWPPTAAMAMIGIVATAAGWQARALTPGGALAALGVGLVVLLLGGVSWSIVLIGVFVSASALSHLGRKHKEAWQLGRGSRRDAVQVLANAGWGAALAAFAWLWPHPLWFAAFAGSMAAVTADTWATEIGTLAPGRPRLITTGERVPPGTSGAVSLPGTLASALGGMFVGLIAALALGWPLEVAALGRLALLGLAAGLVGSLADSVLGATVQAMYHCPICDRPTEKPIHGCGATCRLVKGWPWLNNDAVNALAALVGSGVGISVLLGCL